MSRLMALSFSKESFPFSFYKKVGFFFQTQDLLFRLDFGYHYIVERINARYSSENTRIPGAFAAPLQIEFFRNGGTRALQNIAFDISLFSSPAESGVAVDVAPGGNPAHPFTARPLNVSLRLDQFYKFKDVLQMRLSNVSQITIPGDPQGSLPAYLDFMIIGRYYPIEFIGATKESYAD